MRLKIVLIFGSIALAVAGCGGGGSSSSGGTSASTTAKSESGSGQKATSTSTSSTKEPSGKPLTHSEFVIQMNEICIQVPPGYKERLKKLKKGGAQLTKAEINLGAAVPPVIAAAEEMETVIPPKNEEGTLKEIIAALKSAAKGVEAEPNSELSGPNSPYAEFQAVTKSHGMITCSGL
jgi:hypothetical protein